MELVYLWVEEYKNIKEQGFNFSPRFRCEYDKDRNELIIEENEDYIPNFFGENINITAIVGKNGSGKSSILEILYNIKFYRRKNSFYIIRNSKIKKFFIYYFIKDRLSLIKELNINKKYKYEAIEKEAKKINSKNIVKRSCSNIEDIKDLRKKLKYKFNIIFFSNLFTKAYLSFKENNNFFNISTINLINNCYTENNFNNFEYQYSVKYSKDIENSLILLKQKSIKLPITTPKELNIVVHDEYDCVLEKILNKIEYSFKELVWKKVICRYYNKLDNDNDKKEFINKIQKMKLKMKLKMELKDILDIVKKEIFLEKELNDFLNLICNNDCQNSSVLSVKIDEINEQFIDKLIKFNQSIAKEIDFNILDLFNFNWKPDLSTGEEALLFQFANFYNILNKSNLKDEILILIDEGETSLHPLWQKKYLFFYIDFLKNNFQEKKFHIVLTTHSPFLISDIPNQNIIFLDKDENGNCKVVNGLKEKKQTFGANIHTLLSDSFFMEDGLMGEFAKGKIDELILYLNGKEDTNIKSDDDAQKLINIIGEPIVKKQLQRMLDSKRLKKIEEIDVLKKSIEDMQKRLEELENDKNSK